MDAVPSYRHIPETGKVAQERLRRASVNKRQSGATSKIDLPHRTEVSPGYYNAFPRIGLYGLYSSAWYAGFYTPIRVYQYPLFFSETTMYDIVKDQVVWTVFGAHKPG